MKTNAIRILEKQNIAYDVHDYDASVTEGEKVAALVGKDASEVFKTLVTIGSDGKNYVFVLPVDCTLDLKKAAKAAGIKSVSMLKQKDLFPLTGYVHGGCSPVGMKKYFPTFLDRSATEKARICVSAGKVGLQLELTPADLQRAVPYAFADLT